MGKSIRRVPHLKIKKQEAKRGKIIGAKEDNAKKRVSFEKLLHMTDCQLAIIIDNDDKYSEATRKRALAILDCKRNNWKKSNDKKQFQKNLSKINSN